MSTIKLKRSGDTGSVPSPDDLVQGELSINYADNKLFTLSHDNVTVVDLLEIGERVGVATFNGLSGDVFGVSSLNGLTGHLQGVSAWNGSTGQVAFNDYVSSFNGATGVVGTTASALHVGGLSSDGGITVDGGITASGDITGANFIVPDDGFIGVASNDDRIVFDTNLNTVAVRSNTLEIQQKLEHLGDNDTYLEFTTDDVTLQAGGNEFLHGTSNYTEINTGFSAAGATFSGSVNFEAGISADSGATFSGTVVVPTLTATTGVNATALNMNDNYALPTGAGATGDVLMIANDGDLEFESLKTTATFIVDSDVPLTTGIRYKGLFAVPLLKMDVVNIDLRSHDVSPAGSGDSLSVALKFIRRSSGLEAASPAIQGTVETVVIPLGGEYHTSVTEANVDTPSVGILNNASYLVVDVVSNAGNHTNFTMLVTMEARP